MENLGKLTDFPQLNPFPTTSSKEQMSFNFLDAVTVCSDFEAQENKMRHYFYFSPSFADFPMAQQVKSPPAVQVMQKTQVRSLVRKNPWRK